MLERLKPELRERVEPIVTRWNAFAGKLSARVDEIVAEADAGLDELIAHHPTDAGPLGAAFSAVQARFAALHPKLDDAFEKTEESYDEAIDDDFEEQDQRLLYDLRDSLVAAKVELGRRLDLAYEELNMRKTADWARRLGELARAERARPVPCSQCGAPLEVQVYWQSCQAPCPHCHAVNDVTPGMAAGLFYQGLGVHALSHQAAWREWLAERGAKDRLDARRHPTEEDFAEYLAAARGYWARYYGAGLELHPGLCEDLAQAVEAKLRHYTAWDQRIDAITRGHYAALVKAARDGDLAGVRRLAESAPSQADWDSCAEALCERGLIDAAVVVLEAQHAAEEEDEPRRAWVAERLRDVRRTVRS